jgi:uncharacterized phiE125 gp8 family phage protein
MGLVRLTAPTTLPVSLDTFKLHSHIDSTAEDTNLTLYLATATATIENYLSRSLITQTWEYTADSFQSVMYLPRPKLQSITSVYYYDTDGVKQQLTSFDYETSGVFGSIFPKVKEQFPRTDRRPGAVQITYTAGYGDADDIPEAIKSGILMFASAMNEFRDAYGISISELPLLSQILDTYKVVQL